MTGKKYLKTILIFTGICICATVVSSFIVSKSAQKLPDKLVVLTFDDAIATQYSVVMPLLKKYGFGATFFICEFPPDFADKSKYMSWEQITSLSNAGFEIANHTKSHTQVSNYGDNMAEKFAADLDSIEKRCAQYRIPKPLNFAYPSYTTNPVASRVLREKGYRFARTGGERTWKPASDDPMLVPSFNAHGNDSAKVFADIDQAKQGEIVVLTLHGVPDKVHDWVNLEPRLFERYLQYMKKRAVL